MTSAAPDSKGQLREGASLSLTKERALQLVTSRRKNSMTERTFVEKDGGRSNTDFILKNATPGSIVLIGGDRLIESFLRYCQTSFSGGTKSLWSHVCIFTGVREDGKGVLLECDLDVRDFKFINGCNESTVDLYEDPDNYPNIAILDFSLNDLQVKQLLQSAAEAKDTRYAILEVLVFMIIFFFFGTRQNIFKDEKNVDSCSSFVRRLYLELGIDLSPQVDVQVTAPEDIFKSPRIHTRHLLIRQDRRT